MLYTTDIINLTVSPQGYTLETDTDGLIDRWENLSAEAMTRVLEGMGYYDLADLVRENEGEAQ